ncbi:MAG: hypothetical protein LUE92_14955 [Clostridiales bacterium]|nr:hypothetical protein [Clostridiales bacterium]
MDDLLELLHLRILICFLNEDARFCTVTEIAKMLGEGKQKGSRCFKSMEKEGLLDRSDVRHPVLTEKGRQRAQYYEKRMNIILNHLLYEGLDIDSAEHDAYAWSLFSSENGMKIIRDSEQQYKAKYELRRWKEFDGAEFCTHLADGEYRFPFIMYREHVQDGNNISMSNEGFEHPCVLAVQNGVGIIRLRAVNYTERSPLTGRDMTGKVRNLCYFDGADFCPVTESGGWLEFPAAVLSFINMGSGIGQILHGSVCLQMQCSVGTAHMPESKAIFTIVV